MGGRCPVVAWHSLKKPMVCGRHLGAREVMITRHLKKSNTSWQFFVTFSGWWKRDPFSMVKWPPTIGDEKVTNWITWSPAICKFETCIFVRLPKSWSTSSGGWLNERKRYGHGFLPFLLMFFVVTRWGSNPENALAYPVSAKHPQSVVTPNCSSFRDWEKWAILAAHECSSLSNQPNIGR